jgi:hypothetical protein
VQHPENKKIIPILLKNDQEFLPDLVTILELMPYGLEYLYSTSMGSGTGVLAYIMDCCSCCSNNLRETGNDGEPVNISNIEKKVREEFENVLTNLKC